MTVTLLKRLATLAALVTLAATLSTTTVAAQETRPGTEAELAADQTPELQITRLYGAVLGRDPDPQGLAFWINDLTSGNRTLTQIADAMVSVTPEFSDRYGDLNNREFVDRLYLNVQGRPGETGGVNFWTNELDSGNRTRGGVVLGFSESPEYRAATGSTDPLDRLYCAFFLRNPDPGGKAFWTERFLVAEQSLGQIAQQFSGVPEFSDLYGPLNDREFVELIYKNVLGRDLPLAEVSGPNFWTGQLSTGARTRGEVMVEFSESPEYQMNWTRGAPCPAPGVARPTAVNDSATVLNAGSVDINWAQNDTRPTGTEVSIVANPSQGTVTVSGNDTFTYVHTGAGTSDSFQYRLTSADNVTSTATVSITILPPGADGIPTAVADFAITSPGNPVTIAWASNDTTDPSVTVTNISDPANGSVVNNGDNTFTYTPDNGFSNANDSFTYTLSDNGDPADTSTATVTVQVTGADSGAAVADRVIVVANTPTEIAPLGNDTGSGLAIASFTQPTHGEVTAVQATGTTTLLYSPDHDYTAARTSNGLVGDSFSYTLTDATGNTSTAQVEVVVLDQPECEVFMNFPYLSDNGVGGDPTNIELFFSSLGCVELYDQSSTFQVAWNNVTVDGAAVTTTSPDPANVLRDLAPVSAAQSADFDVTVAGTAVFTVDGATAVTIEFQLQFVSADSGTTWSRVASSFRGRGDADVTVSINPLAS